MGGGGHQRPSVAASCQPPARPLPACPHRPPSGPDTSKQALGHFMCPFIALNGEGLPAWALKGQRQEGCGPSGKCVWGGGGRRMRRSWGSHLTPNRWVGLRPTLFPRSEYCHGSGSTAPTPTQSSKRKPWEDSHSWHSGQNELPVTRGKQARLHRTPSLPTPPLLRLDLLIHNALWRPG